MSILGVMEDGWIWCGVDEIGLDGVVADPSLALRFFLDDFLAVMMDGMVWYGIGIML